MNYEFNRISKFQETIKALAFPKAWRGLGTQTLLEIARQEYISESIQEFWPVCNILSSSMRDVSRAGSGILD